MSFLEGLKLGLVIVCDAQSQAQQDFDFKLAPEEYKQPLTRVVGKPGVP
jgi:hypothetical protein